MLKKIIRCFLKLIGSLPFWLAWVIVTIVGLILGGILDAAWTMFDQLVRPFTPSWNPLSKIIPSHEPWGLISWVWDSVTDFGGWIISYFHTDC